MVYTVDMAHSVDMVYTTFTIYNAYTAYIKQIMGVRHFMEFVAQDGSDGRIIPPRLLLTTRAPVVLKTKFGPLVKKYIIPILF